MSPCLWSSLPSLCCSSLEAMQHPRCVGWGEMGLDYHYDNSPRLIQQEVFIRQLKHAVQLRKPLTIHTREAEEDSERILKEYVPKDHRVRLFLRQSVYSSRALTMVLRIFGYRYTFIATPTLQSGRSACSSTSPTCTSASRVRVRAG